MKILASTLTALALVLLLALPAFARDNQQAGTVTKTFELTINGDVPPAAAGDAFGGVYTYETAGGESEIGFIHFCGNLGGFPAKANCNGNGTIYTERINLPAGVMLDFRIFRQDEGRGVMGDLPPEDILEGRERLTADHTNSAAYDFNSKVTKTFEFTLNGDVPAGQAFYLEYTTQDAPAATQTVLFCGPLQRGHVRGAVPGGDCVGNGTLYVESVLFDRGTVINFAFKRSALGSPAEQSFYTGSETLNMDMTNTAFFNFTGAEADDGQQDMPVQLPDTGIGGLTGAGLAGSIAAIGTLLMAGGYSLLRRNTKSG